MARFTKDDWTAKKQQALETLPVRATFEHLGIDIGTKGTNCPYCDPTSKGRGKLAIAKSGATFFCWKDSCEATKDGDWGGRFKNPPGIYQHHFSIEWREATLKWLLDADVINQEDFDDNLEPARTRSKKNKKKKSDSDTTEAPAKEEQDDAGEKAPATKKAKAKKKSAKKKGAKQKSPQKQPPEETPGEEEEDQIPGLKVVPFVDPASQPRATSASGIYAPWAELHAKMKLLPSDREKLKSERGLTDEIIDLVGFRSSSKSNEILIEKMMVTNGGLYDADWLLNIGILTKGKDMEIKPNRFLTGLGPTGEVDEDGDPIFDWIHPTLIPYHGDDGFVFYMTPHKHCLTPVKPYKNNGFGKAYSALFGMGIYHHFGRPKTVVLSEGELKCAAAAGCGICTIATPGITFIQSEDFRQHLIEFIQRNYINEVVIVFDNDDRSDRPIEKRYNVQIYQLITALWLKKYCKVRIGTLPEEHRDPDGGADWDSILTKLIEELGESAGRKRAEQIFNQTVTAAVSPFQTLDLFEDKQADKMWINSQVHRLFYNKQRNIMIGDSRERGIAMRIRNIMPDLADQYEATYGCYYTITPPRAPNPVITKKLKQAEIDLSAMMQNPSDFGRMTWQNNYVLALKTRLLGNPKVCANFSLTGLYRLVGLDGSTRRLVRFYVPAENRRGQFVLDANDIAQPQKFKVVAANECAATYTGGDQVGLISKDLDNETAHRIIHETDKYGYDERSKLFNFATSSYTIDGKEILPDEQNVIWAEEGGYQIASDPKDLGRYHGHGAPCLLGTRSGQVREDDCDLSELLGTFYEDFTARLGGLEAQLAIGVLYAYGFMDQFAAHKGSYNHPGLWIHGPFQGGKSFLNDLLCSIWGFYGAKFTIISEETTDVAMRRLLAQYGNLPVPFDEFHIDYVDAKRLAVLRSAFDRIGAQKGMPDQTNRTRAFHVHTSPIVLGENPCPDPATMSRFLQVHNAANKAAKDPDNSRYHRLLEFSRRAHRIGRAIMLNRPEAGKRFLSIYDQYEANEGFRKAMPEHRARLTHLVPLAAFAAVNEVLGVRGRTDWTDTTDLETFTMEFGADTRASLQEGSPIDKFWEQLLAAVISKPGVHKNCFRLEHLSMKDKGQGKFSVVAAQSESPENLCLTIDYNTAWTELETHLRKSGNKPLLSRPGMAAELSKQPYWLRRKPRGTITRTWGGTPTAVWAIHLKSFQDVGPKLVAAIFDPEGDKKDSLPELPWVIPQEGS